MAEGEEDDLALLHDPLSSQRLISRRGSEESTNSRGRSASGGRGSSSRRSSIEEEEGPASEGRLHVNVLVAVLVSTALLFALVHNFRHTNNGVVGGSSNAASARVISSALAANSSGVPGQVWEQQQQQQEEVAKGMMPACEPVVRTVTVTVEAPPPPPPPVHPLLERVVVSVAAHWDVTRLVYLERVLMAINEWQSHRVDVCIGSNRPDLYEELIGRGSLRFLNKSGNIHNCALPGELFHESALNWRTREILGYKYLDEQANYTALVFLENDLVLTWDALVAWAEDTSVLEPYGLKRSFFRTEVNPDNARPMHQEFVDGDRFVQYVRLPPNGTSTPRTFVQLVSYTYCGMFVATRSQFRRYLTSNFWRVEDGGRCCDPGAREFASWGFLFFEVPTNQWGSTGLIPWDEERQAMDTIAMIMHRPNNYVIQGHSKASKTSLRAVNELIEQWIESHPPMPDVALHDFDAPRTRRRRGLRAEGGQDEEDEERRRLLQGSIRAAKRWRALTTGRGAGQPPVDEGG